MILLDSNIVIYSAQVGHEHLRPLVINPDNQVSAFTLLEVLGFPKLLPIDKVYFEKYIYDFGGERYFPSYYSTSD